MYFGIWSSQTHHNRYNFVNGQSLKSKPFPGWGKASLSSIYTNKKGKHGVRRGLSKVLHGRLRPKVQPLFYINHFWQKRYSFLKPSFDKWNSFHIPCLELCISFNCCKCTLFKIWINHKTRIFPLLFHRHKMHLLALLGLFTDRNDRFLPLQILQLLKFLPFYTPAWKRCPFRAEPSRIGHYREYPPETECWSSNPTRPPTKISKVSQW